MKYFPLKMAQELQKWLDNALREYVYHRENKICVVAVVGKAPTNELWTKGAIINELITKKAFQNLPFSSAIKEKSCQIETYFDPDSQCIFLNLVGPYDLNVHEFGDESQNFHQWWIDQDEEFTSNLLFLFTVSQIVLFVHPTCRFDISYIRLFRNLNHLREKTLNHVCEILSDINGVSKGWVAAGRAGCPRVLFLFHRPPSFMKPDGTVETRRGSYRKLAVCLEDQIYKLFRKSRVVTNNTDASVCALPPKQSFCYIFGPGEESKDFTLDLLNNLLKKFAVNDESKRSSTSDHNSDDGGFKEFFFDHCDLAHGEGFNDNLGKVGPAHFELPKFKAFVRASSVLYNFFVKKRSETNELNEIPDLINVISKFSEGRCNKVLPIAISNYQDNLPSFYTEMQHHAKLLQALKVLQQQSRGPALEAARKKLTDECESYWRNGHQACESFSLNGNNCVNRVHRTRAKQGDQTLPVMPHNSNIKFLCTCNCGRRQSWRDDPFDVKEANYTFYEENAEFACCRRLDCIEFPVFHRTRTTPSTTTLAVDAPTTAGRRISVDQMFDNLKITTASQEDLSGLTRTTDDFLPDRDNKPALKHVSGSQPESGERESRVDATVDEMDRNDDEEFPPLTTKSQDDEAVDDDAGDGGTGSDISEMIKDAHSQDEKDQRVASDSDLENEGAGDLDVTESADDRATAGSRSDVNEWDASLDVDDDEPTVEKTKDDEVSDDDDDNENDADKGKYIVGMVHNQCPPDLLPLFSSWSLVCLGHSSIYSHSGGLRDHPNFSHGSQFLLAWDVPLHVDIEKWQDLMESMASTSKRIGGTFKKTRPMKGESVDVVTVKIFVGFEYECPRGHRFMLQTPDKMLKFPGPSGPKDNGALIVKNDMPLWFPCSCRQAKPAYLGQLMRVHVVTPKAPVIVTLNPKVQPHSNLPLFFHPGAPGPAKLGPAKYWILRLPFSYVGPNGPLYPSKDSELSSGRVLKGMIGVIPDL